jgi:hypothetical protein
MRTRFKSWCSRLFDQVFMLRGYSRAEWKHILTGGHFWARLARRTCLERGHDVYRNYCYTDQKLFDIGDWS